MSGDSEPPRSIRDRFQWDLDPEVVPPVVWGVFVTAVGFALAISHAIHLTQTFSTWTLVIGVLVPLGIVVGFVIPFGVFLALPRDMFREANGEFVTQIGPWMAAWMVLGMGWMGIAGIGSILYQSTVQLTDPASQYLVIIFASYGVIPGSITGYYYGRTVQAWSAVAERERHLTIFMRVLRHNFRNEMNVLLGELGLAAETAEGPTATHVENAASRGRDLMSTVEKQRCLVEIVADPAQPQVHDLSTVLDSAVERVSGEYPAAEVTSEDPGDTRILAHPQIERAITELLENAIVHSTAAPPRAVVEFARASECAVLSIHDSGARIPPEETSILTAETDPTQLEHGSGLGLWIVNRLVTQSNGSFHVEDDDSAGNTVVVRLPLADAESGKTGRLSSRPGTGR